MRRRTRDPFPDDIEVAWERFSRGQVDELGNPVEGYEPSVMVRVTGIGPPSADEVAAAGHARVEVNAVMYAAASHGFGDRDRVTVRGRVYEVVGDQMDVDLGPFWDLPRCSVNLHHVRPR